MKGLATVRVLKEIEKGTGKRIHELFDLICGTSTGGMLAVALGIKLMTLDQCEEIYKNLGGLLHKIFFFTSCLHLDILLYNLELQENLFSLNLGPKTVKLLLGEKSWISFIRARHRVFGLWYMVLRYICMYLCMY